MASRSQRLDLLERVSQAQAPGDPPAPVPDFDAWLPLVSPKSWHWDWPYLAHIRSKLALVTSGAVRRLMIFCPPRHGKSEQTTIRYPSWRLERDREFRVCVGCYNQTFAERFGRKARRIVRGRLPLSDERSAAREWETLAGGVFRSCGVGNPPTGEGFDLIVIDDPVKSREEAESQAYRDRCWDWFREDLFTRQEPGCAIVLIQTRWHPDDLAGRILASEDRPNWVVVRLPAEAEAYDPLRRAEGEPLCPARYGKSQLAEFRSVLGSCGYVALYQ
jgi:hypothetical protein